MIARIELRKEYKEQTGEDWKMLNPTAQPTIEYVKWLESRLIAMHNDVGSYYKAEIEAAYDKGLEDGYACMPSNL